MQVFSNVTYSNTSFEFENDLSICIFVPNLDHAAYYYCQLEDKKISGQNMLPNAAQNSHALGDKTHTFGTHKT